MVAAWQDLGWADGAVFLVHWLSPGVREDQGPVRNLEVSVFVQAAGTKYHRWGGINHRNLFPHRPGGEKCKIKVPSGLVCGGASLPG